MPKRFTATEKWVDPWFCELSERNKLFWIFLLDNCNHAGIWNVNWPLVNFYFKKFKFDEKVFKNRITIINDYVWFIPKFVIFQQKVNSLDKLNPENKAQLGIIKTLSYWGIINNDMLPSPCQAPSKGLARGTGIGIGIGKGNKGVVRGGNKDEDFIKSIKKIYSNIDVDSELDKMDGWLLNHPGRRKTRKFIINWLNRIEKPIGGNGNDEIGPALREFLQKNKTNKPF